MGLDRIGQVVLGEKRWVSAFLVVCLSGWILPVRADDGAVDVSAVNAKLGLYRSAVERIELTPDSPTRYSFSVPLGEETFRFEMALKSVRSPGFRVRRDTGGGAFSDVQVSGPRTYRGLSTDGAASVAASVTEAGLTAVIYLADARWYVQPLSEAIERSTPDTYVVYRPEDVIPGEGRCGTVVPPDFMQRLGEMEQTPGAAGSGVRVAEIAFDADVEYFVLLGNSEQNVVDDIENIMNNVEFQYDSQLGIQYEITEIIIRTMEPDPYTQTLASSLLNQFANRWNSPPENQIQRDVAHLFTGKNLQAPTLGISFLSTICNESSAYGLSESRFTGTLSRRIDLTTHELGHGWSAPHCDEGPGAGLPFATCCFLPTYTMCSFLAGSVRNEFCPPIVNIIANFRDTRPCLSQVAPNTTLPFGDMFPTTTLDSDLWVSDGAAVTNQGAGEPSAPFSVQLNGTTLGGDRLTSGIADTSGVCGLTVRYWWQRSGTLGLGGSPEGGEDLLVEFRSSESTWQLFASHPGAGGDDLPYAMNQAVLPSGAEHPGFQIRFRTLANDASDNFFVDDISVTSQANQVEIAQHPADTFTCLGGEASFSVTPQGTGPFTFEWTRNGEILPGEDESTLTIDSAAADDFGFYTANVSNVCSTLESLPASLIQVFAIEIQVQPEGATVPLGGSFFPLVVATGQPTYQWFHNNQAIPGATEFFLSVPEVTCADAGSYYCEMVNDCSMATSDVVQLMVTGECTDLEPPRIVHSTGLNGQTRPFSGYLDPRSESSNGTNLDRGLTQVGILFSEAVSDMGSEGGGLTADGFAMMETGDAVPPSIVNVDASQMPFVVVQWDRPITLREWTTVVALVEDLAPEPNLIVSAGNQGPGVDEEDRVDLGFLPGDIDQNSSVQPLDLLRFRQYVSAVGSCACGACPVQTHTPKGMACDYFDVDRNGSIQPLDLLRFRQLLGGSPPSTQEWAGKSMLHPRP